MIDAGMITLEAEGGALIPAEDASARPDVSTEPRADSLVELRLGPRRNFSINFRALRYRMACSAAGEQ